MSNKQYVIYDKYGTVGHSTDSLQTHLAARDTLESAGYATRPARGDSAQTLEATASEIGQVVCPPARPQSVNDLVNELARRVWEEQGVTIESVHFRWAHTMGGSAALISSEVTLEGRNNA